MWRRCTLRDNDCRVIACQSNDRTDSAMHDTSMIEQTESWRGSNAGTKTFLCNNVTCVCIVIGKTTYDIAKKSTSCLNNGGNYTVIMAEQCCWTNNVVYFFFQQCCSLLFQQFCSTFCSVSAEHFSWYGYFWISCSFRFRQEHLLMSSKANLYRLIHS